MELSDVINNKWLNAENLKEDYLKADPFPHIVMEDFFIGSTVKRAFQCSDGSSHSGVHVGPGRGDSASHKCRGIEFMLGV